MKKINTRENFFKDIVFNVFAHKKYLFINKLILVGGCFLNAISFFLYSVTGNTLFQETDFYLRIFNSLAVSGILAIKHHVSINRLNIARDVADLDHENFFSPNINSLEIIPINFEFNEDLPLSSLKKLYQEGAYVIVSTSSHEFKLKMQEKAIYLLEDDDTFELEKLNCLKLSR